MSTIVYNQGCRDCFRHDGMRRSLANFDSSRDFSARDYFTEFEIMEIVENWNYEVEMSCGFCGSNNLEVFDLELDGEKLFDFYKLDKYCTLNNSSFFIISIDKELDNIEIEIGGKNKIERILQINFLRKIFETIEFGSDEKFIEQIKGTFFICVSGKKDSMSMDTILIERFVSSGFSKQEILQIIDEKLFKKLNINSKVFDLNIEKNISTTKVFKGAMFMNSFYFEEEEVEKGAPFSIVYFDFDDNTIIAFDTSYTSPFDFLQENKNNLFTTDDSQNLLEKFGKKIILSKRV